MLKPEQVPKEVVDAFWQHFQDNKSTDGALAAALNAWSGMHVQGGQNHYSTARTAPIVTVKMTYIILPLTEASETEEQAKARRQQEREDAADRIEQLEAALRLAKDALADIGVDDVLIAIDAALGEDRR